MPGVSGRFSTVVKAKISKLLDRAEDPAETLDYSYQKQLESLQNVKKGIADVVTAKKRLELQTQKLEVEMPKLDEQARQALAANREDLARAALERKAFAQQQLQSLDQQISDLGAQQDKLSESEKRIQMGSTCVSVVRRLDSVAALTRLPSERSALPVIPAMGAVMRE